MPVERGHAVSNHSNAAMPTAADAGFADMCKLLLERMLTYAGVC
jgi:hypothetical protein